MIFDELVVSNLGVFGGRQSVRLTPPAPDRPVTLIGGLNGCGKTTMLDAIQLALYGGRARLAGRRGGYEAYLAGLVHRHAPPGERATVELELHTEREARMLQIRVCRSWRITKTGLTETVRVLSNDNLAGVLAFDEAMTADWADHAETLIPSRLASLFFFDGEKIEALAEPDTAREVLKTAIYGLLGVDLVDRTAQDLKVLERRHKGVKQPVELLAVRNARLRDLAAATREHQSATQAARQARDVQAQAQKRVDDLEEAYRLAGGEAFEQRHELEHRLTAAQADLRQAQEEMRDVINGCAPLLLARDLLADVAALAECESDTFRQRDLVEALPDRDNAVLSDLASRGVAPEALAQMRTVLEADVTARRATAARQVVVGLPAHAAAQTRLLLDIELPAASRALTDLTDTHSRLAAEGDTIERRLAGVPDREVIADLGAERDTARAALTSAIEAVALADETARRAERHAEQARRQLDEAHTSYAEAAVGVEQSQRIVRFSEKYRDTLARYRTAIIQRHVGRIQAEVLACLRTVLRKTDLVTDLTISTDTFDVTLLTPAADGPATLLSHQLSAGERQMLAISLLWGLARASGRRLPVIIDTPLGRLDSEHRRHLVQRYFPNAGHQVVLLSTDTEVADSAVSRLEPCLGRTYRLDFDRVKACTQIREGYFAEQPQEVAHAG
ncbi:DNA sulfur modification protein DndD (plasmid) [Nonomuraea sp. NBC_00507]|uniref:DNA sulfur modification protein DndD n=1 Tax=Nonomuraea sp. NBC_00507 TaxID=2976002 RepID=UPI002E17BD4A